MTKCEKKLTKEKTLSIKVKGNQLEKLEKIYGNLNKAGHRMIDHWFWIRYATINELKKVFAEDELRLLLSAIHFPNKRFYGRGEILLQLKAVTNDTEWLTLKIKINHLYYAQAFFLSDWIDCVQKMDESKIESSIKELL